MSANGHTSGTDALSSALSCVREDVRGMKAYTPGEQINECVKLNTNECAWGPSEAVLKALAATLGLDADDVGAMCANKDVLAAVLKDVKP